MSFLVSIIMPAFNAEKYIKSSIKSVQNQTYKEWELIIVDDGSTDSTKEIVAECIQEDSRIKYLFQENKKQAAARNFGISQAKGELIAFLDADDLWEPAKLERQFIVMSKVQADIYYSNGIVINENDTATFEYFRLEYGKFEGVEMYKILFRRNIVPVLSVIVKKDLVDKVGPLDETSQNVGCEDWDYWIRMARAGAVFFGIEEKLFRYRINPGGTSRNIVQMDLAKATALLKNFEKERFSDFDVRKIFKPLIVPLFVTLIKNNRLKDATVLMKIVIDKIPIFLYKLSYLLFKAFKKHSVFPIRVINKIDSLINGQ